MAEQYRKTMADRWLESGRWLNEGRQWKHLTQASVTEAVSECVVLRVDAGSFKESLIHTLGAGVLPACVPPWPQTLVEWTSASPPHSQSYGALCSLDASDEKNIGIVAILLGESASEPVGPLAVLAGPLSPSGDLRIGDCRTGSTQDRHLAPYSTTWVATLFQGLFALTLANCKNITLGEHRPPAALSSKHTKRRGRPLARYYTLDIEPMRKVLRTEGRMDEVGLARALHLCRGHFKDYREGGGLFGRHKGLYWWDSNVRGSVKAGVVAKDYAIKPPGEDK